MMGTEDYDYIIAGAGLSGLSLAWQMIQTPSLADQDILVVDQSLYNQNKKTWSFWHRGTPPFKDLIYKSWNQVEVGFNHESVVQPIEEYTYHSIHSRSFREMILKELRAHDSVDLFEAPIQKLEGYNNQASLQTANGTFTASFIFQSCFVPPSLEHDQPRFPLVQHFLGWEVETSSDIFDPATITLMDFDPNFNKGIAFVYILPQTKNKALLEYTVFSKKVEAKDFYEDKLAIYLSNKFDLSPLDYQINSKEYGEIPMQDHRYAPFYAPCIINLGTVGGLTKPSTGYTFSRIQKHVNKTIKGLVEDGTPAPPYRSPYRYRAYDLWLLQILNSHPQTARRIFYQLFSNNTMDAVFRFLSEENSLLQDLKTISRIPHMPFFRAIWKTKKRLMEI